MATGEKVRLTDWVGEHADGDCFVPRGTIDIIPVQNRLQRWVAKNWNTVVVVGFFSAITWVLFFLSIYGVIGNE